MLVLLEIIMIVLTLYWWVAIIMIVMSWLLNFNVINYSNQFVATIWRIVDGLTKPVLDPIRRFVPSFGGIDISPIILFIGIYALQRVIQIYLMPYAF
ncbi:YggT family protein [Maritalea mediterranea]|uniref:YggT family protein n=1 Tax=Maritalea mediterranea TaxID=2909667 RepID=A0ABS9EEW3_9HYPH|nr:YggT family protein [Maritalea mediterranea]MCF4099948.1 YggT family protein [Maritalea mediterranea]